MTSSTTCAFDLQQGQEYLIFLSHDGNGYATDKCDGDKPIYEAGNSLNWLKSHGKATEVLD